MNKGLMKKILTYLLALQTRTCKHCGKEFEVDYGQERYCSICLQEKQCAALAYFKTEKGRKSMKAAQERYGKTDRYKATLKVRDDKRKAKRAAEILIDKENYTLAPDICICGETIPYAVKRKQFCSMRCRSKVWNRMKKYGV